MKGAPLEYPVIAQPLPLASTVLAVGGYTAVSTGVSVDVGEVSPVGGKGLQVRLLCSLKAGTDGWSSAMLAIEREDGTFEDIGRTQVQSQAQTWDVRQSPWHRFTPRKGTIRFVVRGRAGKAAGAINGTVLLVQRA